MLELPKSAAEKIREYTGRILHVHPVGGGCINRCFQLLASQGPFFLKTNDAGRHPGMFEAEAAGLERLLACGALRVPKAMHCGHADNTAFLLMEFMDTGAQMPGFWSDFGTSLANLHRQGSEAFGLDHNNYIGSLPQSNRQHDLWTDFFIEERLLPQLIKARDGHKADKSIVERFDRLFTKLDDIFPVEPPSLLHGDLWNGNFMCGPDGHACIYDPAIYFGHREMDIAMSRLFGGFDEAFYASYNLSYPMESAWVKRLDICNLYPLLVHVNLFGGGYMEQVKQIIRPF
ncbi:MAG: fructosamine kinase family protein [Flavobacteriales bacterium]